MIQNPIPDLSHIYSNVLYMWLLCVISYPTETLWQINTQCLFYEEFVEKNMFKQPFLN